MSKFEMTRENFDKLLHWLDKDREVAAQKYSSIHRRLETFFLAKKISSASELADKTIDRVVQKVDFLIENYQDNPKFYFFSVAKNIYLEYLKIPKSFDLNQDLIQPTAENDEFEDYYECFDLCMTTLSEENRDLVINYFQEDKQSKIDHHKELMKKLGISAELLRTKIFRIKSSLRKCIKSCLEKKNV